MNFPDLIELITLAQVESAPAGGGSSRPSGGGGGLGMMVPMILMFVIMYFLLIRPQRKKQQELANQVDAMKVGDGVVSVGGIHGIVTNRNDSKGTVTVRVAEGVKMKFDKASIGRVIPKGDGADDEDDSDEQEEK